ncbi:MAG: multidrug MFS transporter [Lachnospiraceae bacterium]|jgi:UDP-N-acetylglucosamine transferase subunit ALG13|nr:multidrug MFS transporter [Lachnospiraceae bacterium]
MVFVTVGTHEQQFNRLVEYMDKWAEDHDEDVVIQTGFSTYEPKKALWSKLYPYEKMLELVNDARIVITHGGPSSFIMPLQIGKIPIVVPRNHGFGEHVNNHQITFVRAVADRQKNIIVVENVDMLGETLNNYEEIVKKMHNSIESNNERFCNEFEKIVGEMMNRKD